MKNPRGTFREQLPEFKEFLEKNGMSTRLFWITKDQVSTHKAHYWIYRAKENKEKESEIFFDSLRSSNTSLRLDAITDIEEGTVCWVENYGGDSQCMNYGILQHPKDNFTHINNPLRWRIIKAMNQIRGEREGFIRMDITKRTNQA